MHISSRNNYPTALPHRPPEALPAQSDQLRRSVADLARQSARLRRLNYWLVGGMGTVCAATAIAMVLASARPNTGSSGTSASVTDPPPSQSAQANPANNTPAAPSDNGTPSAPAAKIDVVAKKETKTAIQKLKLPTPFAKPATEQATSTQNEVFLEALGGLSATHLYQNYLLVGLLADGVESKALTAEGAKNTLRIVADCLDLVDGKLIKLKTATLDPDDRDSLDRIQTVTALLRLQTQTLEAFWSTGAQEQSEQYQQARKAAWTGLSKVLGLDAK